MGEGREETEGMIVYDVDGNLDLRASRMSGWT